MKLADLLDHKGWGAAMLPESVTVETAVKIMCDQQIGSVIVQSEDGRFVGLLTERDVLHGFVEQGSALRSMPIRSVMLHQVPLAEPDMLLEEAMLIMTERRVRHLPIVKDGGIVGIVSIGDIVKATLQEKVQEADALRNYIAYS